jgi:hypothetical protein
VPCVSLLMSFPFGRGGRDRSQRVAQKNRDRPAAGLES